ncbi:MAG: cation:dicarboxylase symporter family transporter [Treponema sp.]|jgi:L-cystine uptake protein TcyP (sodium:dicarboxylate symporter family)|nr:cation:dicarboxylase symporter family transporter [Treponema sp.]
MFTVETLWVLVALLVFSALLGFLVLLKEKWQAGFTTMTVIALVIGAAFGIALQLIFGAETSSGAGAETKKWINIVAQLFTKSLQMVVVPLVFVSIVNAVSKLGNSREGIRKAAKIIGFLLITTAISTVFAIIVTKLFNLNADDLIEFKESSSKIPDVPSTILNLVPNNMFAALTSNSVLPVVFVAALTGFMYLSVKESQPKLGQHFETFLEIAYAFVLKAVHFVINFTPYGVLAIISVRAASGSGAFIAQLGLIIAASYVIMAAIFVLHVIIAAGGGISPITYIRKASPALLFAFSSRSSAATLPLTIEAQRSLGVGEANANLASALGTCIGQNGCAGAYPPMLAILVGLVQGWDVWSITFLAPLVIYVIIASIGTAGVGGGATNVSLLVLSLLGLPVELVAILISVDFIIDMGRTLINVSDSILAGYVTGKLENEIAKDLLNDKITLDQLTTV